jgi:hypothetical protein
MAAAFAVVLTGSELATAQHAQLEAAVMSDVPLPHSMRPVTQTPEWADTAAPARCAARENQCECCLGIFADTADTR